MATSLFGAAIEFLRDGLQASAPQLPSLLDDNLVDLNTRLDQLTAVQVEPSGAGIANWLATLKAIAELAQNEPLLSTLLVRAVQVYAPPLAEALVLADIVEIQWVPAATPPRPKSFTVAWDQIADLTQDPGETALQLLLSTVNDDDDLKALQAMLAMLVTAPRALVRDLEYVGDGFDSLPKDPGEPIGIDLQKLMDLINSPLRLKLPSDVPEDVDEVVALGEPWAVTPDSWLSVDGNVANGGVQDLSFQLHLDDPAAAAQVVALGNGWQRRLEATGTAPQDYKVRFTSTGIDPATTSDGALSATIEKVFGNAIPLFKIDPGEGADPKKAKSNLTIKSLGAGVAFRPSGAQFGITLQAREIVLTLAPDFLSFLSFGLPVPTTFQMKADLKLTYNAGKGIEWEGDSKTFPEINLRQVLPLKFKLGSAAAGVNLDQVVANLRLSLGADGLRFLVEQRYGARGTFGPLSAIMDGAGFSFGNWPGETIGALPPLGIGIAIKAGPVDGGGFIKYFKESDEFGGALQVKILGIGAFAYGLYRTLPNGDPSFVALIGIRLPPPGIQISFGFAISGFGGLVGINRRADTDLLRERLASGSAGDVLFNDNPMANAPKLLGDMQQFFPSEAGTFLIGPTLQINWLYILKLDAGVFIELPGPRQIFIAGSARLVIGSEAFALVYLRMDFIGGIDLVKSLIYFDGALVNSHVLGIFRITGGIALRIGFGANSYSLFSVGGFHPSFHPDNFALPSLARVGVSYDLGVVWFKQEMYLALTSNTFQLGAKVEAGLELGPISAHGWFGFDALIQFKPFYFVAVLDAGFDVEVFGESFCSVRVQGSLTGPGPLVINARASVKLLFVRVSESITVRLNENPAEVVPPIPNLAEHLKAELTAPENLRIDGVDNTVRLKPVDPAAKAMSPVGSLIWEQKRAPLNLQIEKLEGVDLGGPHNLKVTSGRPEVAARDLFGVGTYRKLADAEALNLSRFMEHDSGLVITGPMGMGTEVPGKVELHLLKLPKRQKFMLLFEVTMYVPSALTAVLFERSNGASMPKPQPAVKVHQEGWKSFDKNGVISGNGLDEVQAFVAAKETGGVSQPATEGLLDLAGVV